ncbi:serine protease inhibitor-like protein [Phanerochaete sordida]|uniref:Serine protease inhibitor-like protein n=1 Tax=Phanerochaete sordida TaxID=48140 RepID=A0A9P3LLA3_9APHY|nr:serine protease inhibitor-like protein [Phanerochaete sordida]
MSLANGLYTITSLSHNLKIGRHPIEDRSLLPKRVMAMEPSDDALCSSIAPWTIEESGGETYTMRTAGGTAGDVDGRLYAHLMMEEQAEKWRIERCPQAGECCFVVTKPDRSVCWTVPSDGETNQVELRPLDPAHPPTQVFRIEPVSDL